MTLLIQRASLVAVLLRLVVYAQSQHPATETQGLGGTSLATVVRDLGENDEDLERIKFLTRQPVEAARLLVKELHPVQGVRLLGSEHYLPRWRETDHVVWCFRALRSPTGGMDFRAKTAHKIGDTEIEEKREWFTGGERFPNDGTVRFFGVWMSRDSLYIAPLDAQLKIIRMWNSWYEAKGRTFAYQPFKDDPDIWYF